MAATKQRANIEDIYTRVRADVLGGVHPPGQRLKFSALSQRYEASVSVIREALSRLAEQGLVVAEPRIGFAVRSMTVEDLHDLTMTRIELETLAIRKAIERGGVDWESAVVAAHHRLERTAMVTGGDPPQLSDDWEAAHAQFHGSLLAGAASPWLLGIAATLRDAAEFYRRWSQLVEPTRDTAGEHRGILQAALARDADLASTRLREHYQRTSDIVERGMQDPTEP